MAHHTYRFALAALIAGTVTGWCSPVQAQLAVEYPPGIPAQSISSGASVIVALRPTFQPSTQQNPPATAVPAQGGIGLGTDAAAQDPQGRSDEIKTAIGQAPPTSPETGRLSPITMEGVRAPIAAADIRVADIGTRVLPDDQAAQQSAPLLPLPNGSDRALTGLTYRWQAANVCHFPLYFEERMLERNGVHRCPSCIQPAVSGAKFLGNVVLYPYRATLWPAFENRYTLGHFRPGSPAPALRDHLPWSTDAALVQAGAATAVIVGLPW